jgi:hypothetical protein
MSTSGGLRMQENEVKSLSGTDSFRPAKCQIFAHKIEITHFEKRKLIDSK